jgi:hypothetical protein
VETLTTSETEKETAGRAEPVMYKHRPPPLEREREREREKETTLNEDDEPELIKPYQMTLGTRAHKEGAVVVVGE